MALTLVRALQKMVVMAEPGMGGPGASAEAQCESPRCETALVCWWEPAEVVLLVVYTSKSSGDEDQRGHQAGDLHIPTQLFRAGSPLCLSC